MKWVHSTNSILELRLRPGCQGFTVRWGGVTKTLEMGPYVIRAEWVTVTSITQQDTN